MMMHAALERGSMGTEETLLFFARMPDAPNLGAKVSDPVFEPSSYGAPRPNWMVIAAIIALHIAGLVALVQFDVVSLPRPQATPLVVVNLSAPVPPAVVEQAKPAPTPPEVREPRIVAPAPVVQVQAAPPPPVAIAPPQPKPAPPAVAAPPAGPVSVSNLEERLIEGQPPRYPLESRRKHEQGTVTLRLTIGADGRVQQISIAQSSGFDRLDKAALQAVRSWRWQPMLRDGQPVEIRGIMPIPFVLKG